MYEHHFIFPLLTFLPNADSSLHTTLVWSMAHISLCDCLLTLCLPVTPFTQQHIDLGLSVCGPGHFQQFRQCLFEPAATHMQQHSQNLAGYAPPSFYCNDFSILLIVFIPYYNGHCKSSDPPCCRYGQSYDSLCHMAVESGGSLIFLAN